MARIRLFALVVATGTASAVVAAIVVAIVDIYVTGHGSDSLAREWVAWRPFFSLSIADVAILSVGAIGAAIALLAGRDASRWAQRE